MRIRLAHPDEHAALTAIAFEAKAHWGYGSATLSRWRDDLTVTPESIAGKPTCVAECDGAAVGFFQLSPDTASVELEHLWVRPSYMGQGIGRALLTRAIDDAGAAGHAALRIDADPHAEAFHCRCGALRTGERAAPIDGQPQRVRPQLLLPIRRHSSEMQAQP